ncbi:MAG: leucine-rich repeat protein [Bacilli bacterium]|jgi:hypothetical protein|nr:leucine-rich repeat protein [Bacilli bacterium]
MKRNRKQKKQRKIIIVSIISLLFVMTAGYAAFQTNLNIKVKGNVITTSEDCFTILDNTDGTATITNYDASCGDKVKIPNKIRGLTVTKIADGTGTGTAATGPFTKKNITTVIMPDTITYIGYIAFFQTQIKNIKMPANLKTIKEQAFAFSNLESIELNDGLETISKEAFTRNNLKTIKIPSTVKTLGPGAFTANLMEGDNAFIYDRNSDGSINNTKLNSYANRNNTELIIPPNIKTLGSLSIYLIRDMTEINLPNTVETLEEKFVYNMQELTTINIGSGVKNIDSKAFLGSGMTALKTININRKANAITGSPWGAQNATVNWTGTI